MLGIATRISGLQALRNRLVSSGDPVLIDAGQLIDHHPEWANFGATGPGWGDLCPTHIDHVIFGQPGVSGYAAIWKKIFNIFGGDGSDSNPGLKPVLDQIRELLAQLDTIAAAEDLDALKGMTSAVDTINQIAAKLTAIITAIKGDGTLGNLGIVPDIANMIGGSNKPSIVKPRPDGSVGFPANYWTLREFLSWRRTGRFAQKLWDMANASGRDELRAYALGWVSGWALSTGGASAVASIIGAPYRNQWWRARFVANYVDLWSYGYATAGPEPKPYTSWPNLCNADLHKRITIPGTSFDPDALMSSLLNEQPLGTGLPQFFTDYFVETYNAVYGDLDPRRPKLDAAIMQDGYALMWLVLWFQTSPESLGCNDIAPIAPSSCGTPPSWTTPASGGSGGSGGSVSTPPAPSIDPKIKPENVICAIILAILGVVALCTGGGIIAGGAAIGGAIALAASAGTIDWDKFRCDLAWYRLYLYNGMRALHDVLSLGALVHPYKSELSVDETAIQLLAGLDPIYIGTGDNIVMSKPGVKENFPTIPWSGSGFSWYNPPTDPVENPGTTPTLASAYPSGFIDDPANPFGSSSVFDPAPFPFATSTPSSTQPLGYINAADAVIGWLRGGDIPIPERNADGDRGLGFHDWQFVDDQWTNPVNIVAED
ncbi:MAG: hypothetical protein WC236_11100 [Gallionellaceae bacterium]|jgi:hypothetical protein